MDVVFEYWKWAAAVLAVIVFIVMFRRILWLETPPCMQRK